MTRSYWLIWPKPPASVARSKLMAWLTPQDSSCMLLLTVTAQTAGGQWDAIIDCYGRHHMRVAPTSYLLRPQTQANAPPVHLDPRKRSSRAQSIDYKERSNMGSDDSDFAPDGDAAEGDRVPGVAEASKAVALVPLGDGECTRPVGRSLICCYGQHRRPVERSLICCYGRHRRPVTRSNWLLWPTPQAGDTL